jgi:hypothetical protein
MPPQLALLASAPRSSVVLRCSLLAVMIVCALRFAAGGAAQTVDLAPAPSDSARTRGESTPTRTFSAPAALRPIGSPAEDRVRIAQTLGRAPTSAHLLRSPSIREWPRTPGAGELRGTLLAPTIRTVWNSEIPLGQNEGGIWAGRGLSTQLTTGFRAEAGPLSLIFAPELTRIENRAFDIVPSRHTERSLFSPPWRIGEQSGDIPTRFGNQPLTLLGAGQSALTLSTGPLALGAATENQWWGPGVRNAIVMSNHAPGFPHLFLRSARPLPTRLGTIEGRWIIGALTPSLYFDTVNSRGSRSLSGMVVTLQPAGEPDLTLGVARVVYADVRNPGSVAGHSLDVVTWWSAPRQGGAHAPVPAGEHELRRGREQILSFFGRWILPASGFETYAEWARLDLPTGLRDLLTAPQHTQGYTLGVQWARPLGGAERWVRLQAEATNLEQNNSNRTRPTPSYYVGRSVAHGYTHRGQVVGASIGPGASSQWFAVDFIASGWQVGLLGNRIRWDNDAYYTQPTGRLPLAHDVSVLGGVRGGARTRWGEVNLEVIRENRLNFLFQNPTLGWDAELATDVPNLSVRVLLAPATGSWSPRR